MKHCMFGKAMAFLVVLLMVFPMTGVSEGLTIESDTPVELGDVSLYTPELNDEVLRQGLDECVEDAFNDSISSNCSHKQMYVNYDTEGSEQAKPQDNQYHTVSVKVNTVELQCRDCGETIATYNVNRTVKYKSFHDYIWDPDNSYCDQCGQSRRSCSHGRYKTYSSWSDREYMNETYHLRSDYELEGAKVLVCENCGMLGISSNGQKWWGADICQEMWPYSSKLEKHSYSNGVCKGCGNSKGTTAVTVTLAATEVTLGVGEKYALSPIVTPSSSAKKLKFKSSNSKIAKVDSKGNITAMKAGTATIKATINGKTMATCKVTVKKTDASGIELSGYFGKNIHEVASAIGGMEYSEWEEPEDGVKDFYDNEDISLSGWDTVTIIGLKRESKYMLLGIKVGMSRSTIRDKMKKYTMMYYDDSYSAEYLIKGTVDDYEILLGVRYDDNGYATYVEYGIWS